MHSENQPDRENKARGKVTKQKVAEATKSVLKKKSSVLHLLTKDIVASTPQKTIPYTSRIRVKVVKLNRVVRAGRHRMSSKIRASGIVQIVQSGLRQGRKSMAVEDKKPPKGRKAKTKIKR